MSAPLPHGSFDLHGMDKFQPGKFTLQFIQRHQHVEGLGAAGMSIGDSVSYATVTDMEDPVEPFHHAMIMGHDQYG